MKLIIGLIIILLLYLAISGAIHTKTPTESVTFTPFSADKLSDLVNKWRATQGLNPLEKNETLCKLAITRAKDITTNPTHDKFIADVKAISSTTYFGENLAEGYKTEADALNAWVNSPTHRKNMINPIYTQTCLACDGSYCAQEFSTRL